MKMTAEEFRFELSARLRQHADDVLLRVIVSGNRSVDLTGGKILEESRRAAQLSTAPAGHVVLLLLPHSVELFLLHIGLILTGRIPAILPWPTSRVDLEKYQRNLLHQFRNLPAAELITIPSLAASLQPALPYRVTGCSMEGIAMWEKAFSIPLQVSEVDHAKSGVMALQDPGAALFLQFSGGTTGAQKAVIITAGMLVGQLERLREALEFSSADLVVSWLPLYHDMGLIGCLWLPLWNTAPSVQFAASDWLMNPGFLFECLERYRGTYCWLPNFAFSYMASQRERMDGPYSLSHVRGFINCSEPVRFRSLRGFFETFADWGVSMNQMQASYAMAENVFAVTQTKIARAPSTAARKDLFFERAGATRAFDLTDDQFVSSGEPLGNMQVRIVEPQGNVCSERSTGEIQIFTECLFGGYWGHKGYTRNHLTSEGWYATGDFGFMADGELYVIGRLKDIVIVGGQNIFPEDIESLVNAVSGIYPGRVVAFGVMNDHDTESLIVVAEMKGTYDRERAAALEAEIAKLVRTVIGISPGRVYVYPERWIVKSTAGKISRRETRERYLRDLAQRANQLVAAEAN
jgi:acyl-CoA synthetase (AMP-forming)/AMP-acid ligase II